MDKASLTIIEPKENRLKEWYRFTPTVLTLGVLSLLEFGIAFLLWIVRAMLGAARPYSGFLVYALILLVSFAALPMVFWGARIIGSQLKRRETTWIIALTAISAFFFLVCEYSHEMFILIHLDKITGFKEAFCGVVIVGVIGRALLCFKDPEQCLIENALVLLPMIVACFAFLFYFYDGLQERFFLTSGIDAETFRSILKYVLSASALWIITNEKIEHKNISFMNISSTIFTVVCIGYWLWIFYLGANSAVTNISWLLFVKLGLA